MHVLYVIGTYPLVTTTFVDREVRSLRRLGVDVQILAVRRPPAGSPLSDDQRLLQQDVTYLLPASRRAVVLGHLYFVFRKPVRYLRTLLHIASRPHPSLRARAKTVVHFAEGVHAAYLVRHRIFDELHAHFADRAATIALVAGRLLDTPYSLSIHTGADIFVNPVLLPEKVRAARRVVTCTAHNRTRLAATVGPHATVDIAVVRHGLDLHAYRPEPCLLAGRARVLAVGQLTERKGFAPLIEACHALSTDGYEFSCRIVGEGPLRGALQGRVAALGLGGVIELCGALPHELVVRQYALASVFALPCVEAGDGDVDGIPNALIEAMACGLPVLAGDLPAIRELVRHDVNGLLTPPGDVPALAAALARLLKNPRLRRALARNGRRTVAEMFDSEVNIRRFAATLWPDRFASPVETVHP
jgi:colanic acid/amylovoran biosynthesis glycosyltransferase